MSLVLSALISLSPAQFWQEKAKTAPAVVNLPDFRQLAKDALPAVVNINVEQSVKVSRLRRPQSPWGGDPDDFFQRFFGQQLPREYKRGGLGSGFVISPDGYVLTNNHVVEGADTIKIRFPDEVSTEEFSAKVVGTDARTDIALLKIDAKRTFSALPLGDSTALQVGEWVMAIGNPFGLSHTVSAGIVSAKERRGIEPNGRPGLYDFIQSDAAINPGNSGGPLINLRGEVVGVNAAINAAGQGLGFAIPINMVKAELNELKNKGKVSRSWIGVKIQGMTAALAKTYKLDTPQGAIVSELVEGGPGEKAGLLADDVILEFDGKAIRDPSDLTLLAAQAGVGKTINLLVLRDGKRTNVKITLGEFPGEGPGEAVGEKSEPNDKPGGSLGIRASDITDPLRQQYNLKDKQGAVILDLDESGAAAEAGLRPGDVIVKVNGEAIKGVHDLSAKVKAAKPGDMLRLLVHRGAGSVFVALPKP